MEGEPQGDDNSNDDDYEEWENDVHMRSGIVHAANSRYAPTTGSITPITTHGNRRLQQLQPSSSSSSSSSSWWTRYQQYVQKHQSMIYLYDDIISRLLFFGWSHPPTSPPNGSTIGSRSTRIRWREVLYGCIELHRIIVQIAITSSFPSDKFSLFGTTMEIDDNTADKKSDNHAVFSTTHLRLFLTILQSIYPLSQEMIRTFSTVSSNHDDINNNSNFWAIISYRQALVRRYLEWARFVSRITLLIRYWKRTLELQYRNSSTSIITSPNIVIPGLMQNGGSLYNNNTHYDSYYDKPHPPSVYRSCDEEECRRRERNHQYIGKRTGRRIVSIIDHQSHTSNTIQHPSSIPQRNVIHSLLQKQFSALKSSTTIRFLRIIMGELLYICRPVVQVESEVRIFRAGCNNTTSTLHNRYRSSQFQNWALCLGMDILSLISLDTTTQAHVGNHRQPPFYTNPASVHELQRRRMRLWLYLLRSPIWEMYTEGTIQRCSDIIHRFPLLGGLLRNYIYDYVYYWKFFRAEEG